MNCFNPPVKRINNPAALDRVYSGSEGCDPHVIDSDSYHKTIEPGALIAYQRRSPLRLPLFRELNFWNSEDLAEGVKQLECELSPNALPRISLLCHNYLVF